jgi:hypothetical protein
MVAGECLVIRYQGDISEALLGKAKRTRAEASILAQAIARSSRPFSELVQEVSEDNTRMRGGDIGVWSTIAPEHNGHLLEALIQLDVGQVSDPIDTPLGFQVLRRTPITHREPMAITAIRLRYDPTAAANIAESRSMVFQRAQAINREVAIDADSFRSYQLKYCCDEVEEWDQGRGAPEVELAVSDLAPGEIANEPVDIGWFFLIVKRLVPTRASPAALAYEIPSPTAIDVDAFLTGSDGRVLASRVHELQVDARFALSFPRDQQAILDEILQTLQRALEHEQSRPARVAANQRAVAAISARLRPENAARFRTFSQTWLVNTVMQLPRH